MRRVGIILFTILAFSTLFNANPLSAQQERDKLIYIVSSYTEEMEWSTQLAESISAKVNELYPEYDVRVNYFNADIVQTSSAIQYSFRSILQYLNSSHTEDEGFALNRSSQSYAIGIDQFPAAMVLIGDEIWNIYRANSLSIGDFYKTPLVLTAVSDSIMRNRHSPTTSPSWKSLIPADSRTVTYRVAGSSLVRINFPGFVPVKSAPADSLYQVAMAYNLTGVILPDLFKSNIDLILELNPKIKEIVLFDYPYYNTQYADYKIRQTIKNHFPDINYRFVAQTQHNSDSLYNAVVNRVDSTVYITNAWEINPLYSMRSKEAVDSLFTGKNKNPIFSLKPKSLNNNWDIGGVTFSIDECVDKTVEQISKILSGENVNSIPFIHLEDTLANLNLTALKKYGLQKRAKSIENIQFVNIPLSFYEKNQRKIYILAFVLFLVGGIVALQLRRHIHIRDQVRKSDRYKSLYAELQTIYQNTYIDFAIYDKNGNSIIKIASAEANNNNILSDLLPENLFSSTYLSDKNKEVIWGYHPVNQEIIIDVKRSDSNILGKELYQIIVRPLNKLNYRAASFMAAVINLTPILMERKAKERIENLLQFASEHCKVGIAYYNLISRTGYANETWYTNLNEPVRDRIEASLENLDSKVRVEIWDYLKKMREGETEPLLKDIYVSDGPDGGHWIRQYIYQMKYDPNNEKIEVVELNINIDSQKHNESKLSEARIKAELSNKETEEFLANISHEVRTPLNAIIGFSNILALSDEESEEMASLGDIIRNNNQLLRRLLMDILLLSQFDSGFVKLNRSDVDLNPFILDLEPYIKDLCKEKRIELKLNLPQESVLINTDSSFLTTILKHLLSNAVKFTEEGSITVSYHREELYCYFSIEDTGKGIPKEKHELIFKRFEKLDTFIQGSGLGLPLCKSIVHTLGGEMGLSSKEGKGSIFWFILPVKVPDRIRYLPKDDI